MLRACLISLCLLMTFASPGVLRAQERDVDLELVLLADSSGSIDEMEIALQRRGYAEAMVDEEVLWAIRNGGALGRIAVIYVEWAGANSQHVVVDWMIIEDEASAEEFGRRLMEPPRRAFGSNALGSALLKGLELIESSPHEGWRKVIDLSGDSAWNPQGPPLEFARDVVVEAGITINGLAILCENCSGRPRGPNLEAEFQAKLIGGPGAFVVAAEGLQNFQRAVRRKLIQEIADLRLDEAPRPFSLR